MHEARSIAMSARAQTMVLTVTTDAGPIAVTVTRKRVKNLNLRVRGDGRVVASVPMHTSTARAQAFLDRRASWIAAHVLRHRERDELEAGSEVPETYPLWGALVPTEQLLNEHASRLPATDPHMSAPTPRRPTDHAGGAHVGDTPEECTRAGCTRAESALPALTRDEADEHVAARYRQEVERALPAVVEKLEQRMGVHANRWQVRSMKTRWGSCTPRTRAIRINARLAAYPPACLEFVVAHELCHLMEPSHNQRFHTLLDIYCPENRACAALLRQPARSVARA